MILPVFLPHVGCGTRCIYCNQEHITKKHHQDLTGQIESLLRNRTEPAEVALYGGNPFGLAADKLEELFRLFEPYANIIRAFRLSAKPVTVDAAVIGVLKRHRVETIELGIPNFNDHTLALLQRGHTVDQAIDAFDKLRNSGFKMGIQVMVGLPGETANDVRETTRRIAGLMPAFVRIYPLVVIKDTVLFDSYSEGTFTPDSLDVAVRKAVHIYVASLARGIRVIKMGLTENDVLRDKVVDGPFHPAFGYLVKSEAYRLAILHTCCERGIKGKVVVRLHPADLPHLTGLRRSNITKLRNSDLIVDWVTTDGEAAGCFTIEFGAAKIPGDLHHALMDFDHDQSVLL